MKKVFSIFAALVVAMTMMVSCGTVKSAKDGINAGEAFAKAYTAANGDLNQISAAYQNVAAACQAYQADPQETTTFLIGVLQSAEEKSLDCAGTFLACYASACAQMGVDATSSVNTLVETANNKAGVKAAYDKTLAEWAAIQAAAMEAAEAEAEDAEYEDGEEEDEE